MRRCYDVLVAEVVAEVAVAEARSAVSYSCSSSSSNMVAMAAAVASGVVAAAVEALVVWWPMECCRCCLRPRE